MKKIVGLMAVVCLLLSGCSNSKVEEIKKQTPTVEFTSYKGGKELKYNLKDIKRNVEVTGSKKVTIYVFDVKNMEKDSRRYENSHLDGITAGKKIEQLLVHDFKNIYEENKCEIPTEDIKGGENKTVCFVFENSIEYLLVPQSTPDEKYNVSIRKPIKLDDVKNENEKPAVEHKKGEPILEKRQGVVFNETTIGDSKEVKSPYDDFYCVFPMTVKIVENQTGTIGGYVFMAELEDGTYINPRIPGEYTEEGFLKSPLDKFKPGQVVPKGETFKYFLIYPKTKSKIKRLYFYGTTHFDNSREDIYYNV